TVRPSYSENYETQRHHFRLRRHSGRHHAAALASLAGDRGTASFLFSRRPLLLSRWRSLARHSGHAPQGTTAFARSHHGRAGERGVLPSALASSPADSSGGGNCARTFWQDSIGRSLGRHKTSD